MMSSRIDRARARAGALGGRPGSLLASAVLLAALLLPLALMITSGCSEGEPRAVAKEITSRSELIGGPGALGEVGDFLLENDSIRVVVQGKGFSRGFGVYGGGLIDADLQRPLAPGGQLGRDGRSQFGELFPVFFLQALVPEDVRVVADGSDGGPARVRTRGNGGDFLTMTKTLNQFVLNSHDITPFEFTPDTLTGEPYLEYETIYELHPGDRFVTIITRVTNTSENNLEIPPAAANAVLGAFLGDVGDLEIPMGAVMLFGDGNKVFTPGFGFDLQFSLAESYKADLSFPAIPGVLASVLATSSSNGVSYAFFTAPNEHLQNFAASRVDDEGNNLYEKAYGVPVRQDSMLVPFIASAFTGVFHSQMPTRIDSGESFEVKSYFAVGDGGVASAMEPFYQMRGEALGMVRGRVFDERSLAPLKGASVVILDEDGKPVNQMITDDTGRFRGRMPAGEYSAVVELDPTVSEPAPFTLAADKTALIDLALPSPARVAVTVLDEMGQRLPARATVVGTVDSARSGELTRHWLFDLALGQRWRASSMVVEEGHEAIRYVEGEGYTRNGSVIVDVRPGGPYKLYVSRGMEYDLETIDLGELKAGQLSNQQVVLRRTIDTDGYTASDFHIHASPSLDASLDLVSRVVSAAGEGLEYVTSADHNIVVDLSPYIVEAGVERWLRSMVGVELTTLEAGHFNAFPIEYDPGLITKGSPEWALRPPDDIFEDLRGMGAYGPENTIIQVNHPRDSILGYFAQHSLDPLTAIRPPSRPAIQDPSGPAFYYPDGESTFSWDFDAIEVFNGKRLDQLRSVRMPEDISQYTIDPEILDELPEPGTIICRNGRVAWPGAVDDWFNFLNLGKRYTIIGNSDSHDDKEGSIGTPRSYVWTGKNDPHRLNDLDIVRGVLDYRVIVTNGPFLELFVDGEPIGSDVVSQSGDVEVTIRVQVSNWIDVNRINLYANGETIHVIRDPEFDGGLFEEKVPVQLERDTWFVAEATGERQLFPIVPPIEIPPIELGDAFESIAGPLGFGGGGPLGNLIPNRTGLVTPYAITNAIWVDLGGDGFEAPGVTPYVCPREGWGVVPVESTSEAMTAAEPAGELTPSLWFPRVKGDLNDFRLLFDMFR